MIYQKDTEEILRLVAKYYVVYEILRDAPIGMGELKKRLMEEYGLAESTARSYINAIIDDQAGALHLAEDDTVYVDQDEVIEFEERLEGLFNWDRFDYRHKLYLEALTELQLAELEIGDLKKDLTKVNANLKRSKEKNKKEIDDMQARICDLLVELDGTKKELLDAQNNLIRVKDKLSMVLEEWNTWRFMWHRIDFHVWNLFKKITKESK